LCTCVRSGPLVRSSVRSSCRRMSTVTASRPRIRTGLSGVKETYCSKQKRAIGVLCGVESGSIQVKINIFFETVTFLAAQLLKMRNIGISLGSLVLTGIVVFNAYYQKKQFYPSVVYITKSNASMAVIYIQSLVLVLMMGKLMRKIFLGQLRPAEFEHLMERFWYALTETCLAFTVFRDDFNPRFVALFTVLLFIKSFHWLAEDRVDFMERSPVIGWLFHARVTSLLSFLGLLDYYLISYAYSYTLAKGPSVQLVFGFEYAILITIVANAAIKYILHAAELRSQTPWENKAVFLLYTELVIGFVRVILYVIFVVLMVKIYTLPLFAFRPMYYTMRNFKKALNDVILSRRAIRNMNTLYPDATAEELAGPENLCIICREDMVNNAKKLPCGHIFHTSCLRSWFQRQQTCPTCRLNILRAPTETSATPINNQPAAAAAPPVVDPANLPQNPFINLLQPPTIPVVGAPSAAGGPPGAPFILPPFPFMAPFAPPPPIPTNLDALSDEELHALEGNERRHIEERLKLLRNVQLMLDASTALMNQYAAVMARLPPVPPVVAPVSQPAEPTPTASTEPTPGTSKEEDASTPKPPIAPEVKIEDIGSEDYVDISAPKDQLDTRIEPIEDPNDPVSELRRRRLQKFLKAEADGYQSNESQKN